MDRLKSIMVAVDFSACSADAFRQAARIAEWNGASLSAMHAVPLPGHPHTPYPFIPIDVPTTGDFVGEARRRWEGFAPDAPARRATDLAVVVGGPRSEIVERVRSERPDLLVVGAHGDQDAARGIGATAAACVQRAPARVMVIREGAAGPFTRVVACVDFSETSRIALDQAIRITAQDGSFLHILHVYQDPWGGLGPPDDMKANMPDFWPAYEKAVVERLASFCDPLGHEVAALKATFHAFKSADHGLGIIDFVNQTKADLVVLGTRARWNLRDAFWGSTAERVVRAAPCSILTVKPEGFDQPAGTSH
ncbi:MAG: universal stress protein [Phycisphaeraceae bacterium]|nr:universal stress protein [Phycisphaerae bacterium]MBX3393355.1 universal stress protein [Phycisphaeraceae bacterium]